jgi:uncharacterized protein YyaL (SSP411 family)
LLPREYIEAMLQRRGSGYRPRTRHLHQDGSAVFTNRLFLETSPYLLQHAHNPVNWFPWGDEAFELARRLARPVLVSIGYATCHWCHVMEEESFEDEEIAQFLNQSFITVKVDREERPDVDSVYMSALHAMGSQGGWPLNVFLTPDRRPFYGGTYFPPRDHMRGIGFLTLLHRLKEACSDTRKVERAGEQLAQAVRELLGPKPGSAVPEQVSLEEAINTYRSRFDAQNGGMTGAPKFPSSLPVRLLLRRYHATGDREILGMAWQTLRRMAAGGLYDQVGGGFHRYATDEAWQVPHFEKMLYDNALLAVTYLEGYQVTKDPELAEVVRETLRYLQRDMAAPGGAFYSATDADSLTAGGEREEGIFFTWTPQELDELLGKDTGPVVARYFGITPGGNFEGRSIPHREQSLAQAAASLDIAEEQLALLIQQSRDLLYRARQSRPLPLRDEKILASWNGLALSAFAKAGLILDDAAALNQARLSAKFMLEAMVSQGRLAHSYQEGNPKGEGFLDDYAFVIAGLIDLFEASGELHWLESAQELSRIVQRDFADEQSGGFFLTSTAHETLIAREKPAYDGAVPSGNSVMVLNLLRLHLLTDQHAYLREAERALAAFGTSLRSAPTALGEMLLALEFYLAKQKQVVIVAPMGKPEAARQLLEQFRATFTPNCVLAVCCEGDHLQQADSLLPLFRDRKAPGESAVAYLCEAKTCRRPTGDPEEFGRLLRGEE